MLRKENTNQLYYCSYDKKENENIIEGRNAVMEAFRSGKPVDKLYVLDGCQDGAVRSIIREARKHDTILNFVEKDRLNQLSETGKHHSNCKSGRGTRRDHSEETCSRTDGNCGKNFRRCAELYAGCKSNESGKDDGRSEEEGSVVRVCRYGRRCHV